MVKMTKTDKMQKTAEEAESKNEVKETKKSTKTPTKETTSIKTNATLADLEVVLYPLVTEKSVNLIESENKISFVVANNADKKQVKKVVEEAYGVKVDKINIIRDMKGRKKAIIKLKKEFKAGDLATKLKIL